MRRLVPPRVPSVCPCFSSRLCIYISVLRGVDRLCFTHRSPGWAGCVGGGGVAWLHILTIDRTYPFRDRALFRLLIETSPSFWAVIACFPCTALYRGPPVRRWVCASTVTALWREAAFFIEGYECSSPVLPSDWATLYRDTALYRDIALRGDAY